MQTVTDEVRTSALSADELLEFHHKGFLRPGRVFASEQVEMLRDVVERARTLQRGKGEEYDLLDPNIWPEDSVLPPEPGKSVGFLFNLWTWDKDIRLVSFNPILAGWASQLLGAREVRILEDNALFKDPGKGGSLKWHQDYPYWPLAQPNAVTAWLALDDVTAENGAMQMVPGSHVMGETLPAAFGTGSTYLHELRPPTVRPIDDPVETGLPVETITVPAGSISMHHCLTWHASLPNISSTPRRAIVVRFVTDGTRWFGSRRYEFNYSDDEVGIEIGDPIGGKYFPIVPF